MLNLLRRSRRRQPGERGITLVLLALALTGMMGVSALVVDLGAAHLEAGRIQKAADAAALAGVVRLPNGFASAETRAREVASANGYTDGVDGVTVTVIPVGVADETIQVTITRDEVQQYFSQVFRDPSPITRSATAQYVQPVPLGSPRNYLGTATLPLGLSGDGIENFYLAVSGECTRREYGDRITPRAMNNPSSPHGCTPGSNGALANPEHDNRGYLFGVTVPPARGALPVHLQMFDAPVCTNTATAVRIYGEGASPFNVTVTVRRYDDLNPYAGTVLATRTFTGSNGAGGNCGFPTLPLGDECNPLQPNRLRECWTTLHTVSAPGDYTIQVDPAFVDDNTRHDIFSLRARNVEDVLAFDPCTSDTAALTPTPPYAADCSQVYGLEHLPIYAASSAAVNADFFLASIDDRHSNKTLQVTLYDSAEGATSIRLLDPNNNPVTFEWLILCANGSEPSSGSCPGEANPTGGRTGAATSTLDVSGSGTQPFSQNVQPGKYSDRLIRLRFQLPDSIATAYSGRTWWKLRYGGTFTGDRTTWSVQLLGDPVRLLPNP